MSDSELMKGGRFNWFQFMMQVLSALVAALTTSASVNAANLLIG